MRLTSTSGPRPSAGGIIATLLLTLHPLVSALQLDPNSTSSIKSIAKTIAKDMVGMYHGHEPGGTPGLLPDPYYWWYAGAFMGTLVDYWAYTGDDQYVDLTKQALLFQVGDHDDYMPINQTRTEGNDDQGFWALTVMSAAEFNFPHPDPDQPQWLGLAQAVFNTQAARWDTEHCNGGLRWQIFQWNKGYDYKNSISQACFFALGARLALFTGNDSYADWADKTWDWMEGTKFIDPESYYVYDGGHIGNNCTKLVPYQFSYNAGGMILGAAAMYNFTESPVWKTRLDNLLEGAKVFFQGPQKNIMSEVACEPVKLCNLDQTSFKAYLSRWLAVTTQWAPHTRDLIMPLLRASAVAATDKCAGGENGRMCGLYWTKDKFEGQITVGQQMAALEVTLSCMIQDRAAPLTKNTGGTSKANPGGGGEDIGRTTPDLDYKPLPAGDKAGAAILTLLIITGLLAGMLWIFFDETSPSGPVDQMRSLGSSTTATFAALAAGGGAAAILGHKKENANKKNGGVFPASGKGSSQVSAEKQAANDVPVGAANGQTTEHHRRVSSMPMGWPQNPVMRGSTAYDSDGIYPVSASARHSRGDWAVGGIGESSSGPGSSAGGNRSYTQQETTTGETTPGTEEFSLPQGRNNKNAAHPTEEFEPVSEDQRGPSGTIGVAQ
ncbi:related to DFG5 protein [Fusarium torulosum]|uniref:mannan endo-1,6-alpha-mannosidase n=1 Tax=Fusarium torulosum TaxID=33205 RepID=A0AAE8MLB6_9HYPO|nr:related to DFG5 protein [Fusarium torulosum]